MKHIGRRALRVLGVLGLCFFFAYGVASFFDDFLLQYEQVEGSSMEPELTDGEQVFITPVSYWFQQPERFEVIAFEKEKRLYVKRIIGLPGETVRIQANNIYIDDVLLPENFGGEQGMADMEAVTLSGQEYFVLGDNRAYSMDSRDRQIGAVERSQIKGKVLFH